MAPHQVGTDAETHSCAPCSDVGYTWNPTLAKDANKTSASLVELLADAFTARECKT